MLRSSRASLALIRSLLMSTAVFSTVVATSTVLVGCEDENEPPYWLGKLDDPKWRPAAVKRLTQFLDDALTRAEGNMEDPQVVALKDQLVGPLTQTYVDGYGDLDTKTRVNLIKLLADFKDERAVPALKKAFEEFAKRPRETKDEQDIKWAVRAYGKMGNKELAGPVLAAFEALKAHTQLGGITYKDYSKAMAKQPDPSWEPKLLEMIQTKMKHFNEGKNKQQKRDLLEPYRDQSFWQITAAQVLGELKSKAAVEPLAKMIVDPSKSDAIGTAMSALVKIGQPSIEKAQAMFNEKDPVVVYAKERTKEVRDMKELPKGNPVIGVAATIIGSTGRAEGVPILVKALDDKGLSAEEKAMIAKELPQLPATSKSKDAFKSTFESISINDSIQGLLALAASAANFYDPGMVDWLLQKVVTTKGGGEEKKALQQTLLVSALQIAPKKDWAKVTASAKRNGGKEITDLVEQAEPVVKACGDDVGCYLKEVEKSEYQNKKKQFAAIKAAYMIGVLGDDKSRDALVERLPSLENGSVHDIAAQTIDQLSPKAAPQVVEALEERIEKNEKSADAGKMANNAALKRVAARISVR